MGRLFLQVAGLKGSGGQQGKLSMARAVPDFLVHTACRIELKVERHASCEQPDPPSLTNQLWPEPNDAPSEKSARHSAESQWVGGAIDRIRLLAPAGGEMTDE